MLGIIHPWLLKTLGRDRLDLIRSYVGAGGDRLDLLATRVSVPFNLWYVRCREYVHVL